MACARRWTISTPCSAAARASAARGRRATLAALARGIAWIALRALLAAAPLHAAAAPGEGIVLRDYLGRAWRSEWVRVTPTPQTLELARAGRALVGPDGKPVPSQLVTTAAGPELHFIAELDPFEARTYAFSGTARAAATDIRIEDMPGELRIANGYAGVAVRKTLQPGQGPIAGLKLRSGAWMGDSSVSSGRKVTAYSAQVTARGPVYAEVVCTAVFDDGGRWEMRLRVQVGEPVVLVDETFTLKEPATFALALSARFSGRKLLYRAGAERSSERVGRVSTAVLPADDKEPDFVLEPWLHWWERLRQGTWFGLYDDAGPDLIAVGTRAAAAWVDPAVAKSAAAAPRATLVSRAGTLQLEFPLRVGARKWMLMSLDREASLARPKSGYAYYSPLPQQYLIKHGDFPLDAVKDYVLDWPGDEDDHPRLLVTRADASALRARRPPDRDRAPVLAATPLTHERFDEHVATFLATGDAALGRHLATTAVAWVQAVVNELARQGELPTLGFAPHHRTLILSAVQLLDAIWSTEHLTPELRARVKGQLAFLGYTVTRPDFWSTERGFSANPNMTTNVAAFQVAIGSFIPAHPRAAAWAKAGLAELKANQLDRWADDNGGWLEAPHYAMVSYDYLLSAFVMARNAGFADHVFDPKMKKVAEWLAKISTPPDSQNKGARALPPIGNTWMRESSGIFGIVAGLWKTRDPVFAAEMQWMHRQHGSREAPGVGGFFPGFAGYRSALVDAAIPEKPPRYASELFPRTGAVLRSHFPSARETQLLLIAGTNHEHYDRDSGSFTLWAKGRVVSNDFGYYGRAPGADHNLVTSPRIEDGTPMLVTRFVTGEDADYVRLNKDNAAERQIVLVKDPDPLGPNYVVLRDTVQHEGTWRVWFSADRVTPTPQGASVEGREDVDTEVFLAGAASPAPSTAAAKRATSGLTNGVYGEVSLSQTALQVPVRAQAPLTAVLYPRLKTQPRPVFTAIADGKGVKVQGPAGTDYVFASAEPFSYSDGPVRFEGTVGAVLARGARVRLWLGENGAVSAGGEVLRRSDLYPLATPSR